MAGIEFNFNLGVKTDLAWKQSQPQIVSPENKEAAEPKRPEPQVFRAEKTVLENQSPSPVFGSLAPKSKMFYIKKGGNRRCSINNRTANTRISTAFLATKTVTHESVEKWVSIIKEGRAIDPKKWYFTAGNISKLASVGIRV